MDIKDILKSTKTKLIGGGTTLGIIVTLITSRIDTVERTMEKRLAEKENHIMREVDYKHNQVMDKLEDLESLMIKLDQRIYELNKKVEYSNINENHKGETHGISKLERSIVSKR